MLTKTISMTLDQKSLDEAIREIELFEQDLKNALDGLCRVLMDEGVAHAKMELTAFPAIDTGALMASIGHGMFDPSSGVGIIYAGAYYAAYVEYGTGVRGEANPHPEPGTAGWKYNLKGYGKKGKQSGWYYQPVGGGGKWVWTSGMPARPFMYNTLRYLEEYAERKAGDIIATYAF